MYKVDCNITIINYKGAIVAMPNESGHTASSQTTSQLANNGELKVLHTPSLCLKGAIYHHFLLFKGVSMVNLKASIDYNAILFKAQLDYIATVSASETHSKRPVCIKVSEWFCIVFALR